MRFKASISHKGLLLVSIPLIFELIFVVSLSFLLKQTQEVVRRETRSRAVVAEANQLSRCLFDAGTSLIGWKYFRTDLFLNREKQNFNLFERGLARLKELTVDDERQKQHVMSLDVLGHKIIKHFEEYQHIAEKNTYPTLEPMQRLRFIQEGLNPFLAEVQLIDKEESKIIEGSPLSAQQSQQALDRFLIVGVLVNVILTLALAMFFSKEITRRIGTVIDNSRRLANKQPLLSAVGGNDEVTELDSVFHQMAQALALSERRRREVIEMVGHDLRSPLSSIKVTLALLTEGVYGSLSETGASRVSAAELSSERLLSLINDLLDVERLESGSFELDLQEVSVKSAIDNSIGVVKPLAEEKNLKIEVECQSDYWMEADKNRVVQIIVNLLSNAIKFSPKERAIGITASESGDSIKISVKDEGPGIASEDQARIFDHYQQVLDVDHAPETQEKSSGLGLAICKALVAAHKGKIGVLSEIGQGSTFWFEIPITAQGPATCNRADEPSV